MLKSKINKMESLLKLLSDSNYCRLCGEENLNGINLFESSENSIELFTLINTYLPIKIEQDDSYPKTICPGCHIQLEATKLFLDLILEGQEKLRTLLKIEQNSINKGLNAKQDSDQVLQNQNSNITVETFAIQTDDNGENYMIQIYTDGPLFPPDHQLALKAEGLEKPKKKRGRPPKSNTEQIIHETANDPKKDNESTLLQSETAILSSKGATTRYKRKIRPPIRYDGAVQGKELVKILKNEGVIEDEIDPLELCEISVGDGHNFSEKIENSRTVIGKVIHEESNRTFEKLIYSKTSKVSSKNYKKNSKLSKSIFACKICNKEFQNAGRCNLHEQSHNIKYSCKIIDCGIQDENKEIILEHQKITGHEGIDLLEQIQNGVEILQNNHTQSLIDVLDEENEIIDKDFNGININKDSSFKCDKCNNIFSCKQNYEVHLKAIHQGEKSFKCRFCEKEFAYACSLKAHMLGHRELLGTNSNFKCEQCDKNFSHPSSLLYHKDTEHGNRKFVCNKCNKSFKHRQLLVRHQLAHSEERPFKCNECARQFKSKTNLINHENIHKGLKKYVCSTCGNSFLHKTSLWVHMKLHDGTKPYECATCKKSFAQKGNLIEHQRIHTGEKPFICHICRRSFTTSSQWKLHLKRHTGEKPHTCKYCQKGFLSKESYFSHIRRHLGERPFQCKFCPKAFPEQWACTRHERIHLGVKKYKCDLCEKAFTDGANFSKHRKIHFKYSGNKDPMKIIANIEQNDDIIINEPIESSASSSLQFHSILDPEGNEVNITTADGQPIPIISSGDEILKGLLPDGTLVNLNIVPNDDDDDGENNEINVTDELSTASEMNLLNNDELELLEDNSISNIGEEEDRHAFLSEDGKVCFITNFVDNSFIRIN